MTNRGFRQGFTLLETIVVIALSALILLAVTNLFITFYTIYGEQEAYVASGSAGTAMAAIEAMVRPADAVVASHTFAGTARNSGASVLVLQLPSVDRSGSIITGSHDYVAFYANGADLYRVIDGATGSARISGTKQLSSSVSALTFSYDNTNLAAVTTVTTDLSAEAASHGKDVTTALHEAVRLRNL